MPVTTTDHSGNTEPLSWAELSPAEHLVQIYPDDGVFLDTLEDFVRSGLRAGEGVVAVATPEHLAALEQRLMKAAIDLPAAVAADQYIALDARRTLLKFMNRGWPDDVLFARVIGDLLDRAGRSGTRRVRAFGEMVVLLWDEGHTGATIRLEQLWHELCRERNFSLLCAYPSSSFARTNALSIRQICSVHSKVVHA